MLFAQPCLFQYLGYILYLFSQIIFRIIILQSLTFEVSALGAEVFVCTLFAQAHMPNTIVKTSSLPERCKVLVTG